MGQSNYFTGHEAEKVAAAYLETRGYHIEEVNWKTPVCEIDLIAKKDGVLYFVEVKYRKNSNQGEGFDYITPKKLQQMRFAAQCWVQKNNYHGDYELAAIALSEDFQVTEFIAEID